MTTTGSAGGSAFDAKVVTGHDERSEQERSADERRIAEEAVERLKVKRDKAAERLADAERALVEAEAELEGGN